MSRSRGGTSLTTRSPIRRRPSLISSSLRGRPLRQPPPEGGLPGCRSTKRNAPVKSAFPSADKGVNRERTVSQVTRSGLLTRRLLFAVMAVGLAALFAYALTNVGGPSAEHFFTDDLYLGLELVGVLLIAWRAVAGPDHRAAWWCIAVAFACWTAGDLAWVLL